jgi:fluoride exporter
MDKLLAIIYVACGAAGSVCRYLITQWVPKSENGFPAGTFTVNILGSLLIGFFMGAIAKSSAGSSVWLLAVVGFCGGFTTFSAISYEGFNFIKQSQFALFFGYFAVSMLLGLIATWAGYILGNKIF